MTEAWEPSLADVGVRIPTRTRDQTTPGATSLLGTFNDKTVPTDVAVAPLIASAVATVLNAVTTVTAAHYSLAQAAAAWRAAADVELAYPERDGDIDVYERLNARAALALKELTDIATDAGAGADATLPQWAMPVPVAWGDDYL